VNGHHIASLARTPEIYPSRQHIQSLQPNGVDGEEIHCDGAVGLRTVELSPGWPAANRQAEACGTEDLLDRGCRDHDAKALQFTDEALIAPPRVLPAARSVFEHPRRSVVDRAVADRSNA
jgi:hypothetical protein